MASPIGQLINGHAWDFSSIEAAVEGVTIFTSLQEINYDTTRDRTELRGSSVAALSVTRGQTSSEGSLVIAKQDVSTFYGLLAGLGGGGIMDGVFDLIVTYSDPSFALPIVDALTGVRLNSISNAHAQGSEALTVSHDVYISRILYGGLATDNVIAEGLGGLLPSI